MQKTTPLAPIGVAHTFAGINGTRWSVREYDGENGDGPCLIFDCDMVFRRVRLFPANWRELEPDALVALSWSR